MTEAVTEAGTARSEQLPNYADSLGKPDIFPGTDRYFIRRTFGGDDVSTLSSLSQGASPQAGDTVEEGLGVLAMISFISNRLVSGAASQIREAADVSVNEGRILLLIDAEAASTAAELMRIIGIDQAAISRCVKRLIEGNYILSTPDLNHGKRNIISLTDKGRNCARGIFAFNAKRQQCLLSSLSTAEQAFLSSILAQLLANVDTANEVKIDPTWFEGPPG